jgi:ArsR family transcriptional regulator
MTTPSEDELVLLSARRASSFLRTLANENRLVILCNLVDSEKSVSELNELLGLHQPTLSQHLARLRADGFVSTRRQGKSIYYSLSNKAVRTVIGVLYDLFCAPETAGKKATSLNDRTNKDPASKIVALRGPRDPLLQRGDSQKPRRGRAMLSGRKRETPATSRSHTQASRRR